MKRPVMPQLMFSFRQSFVMGRHIGSKEGSDSGDGVKIQRGLRWRQRISVNRGWRSVNGEKFGEWRAGGLVDRTFKMHCGLPKLGFH